MATREERFETRMTERLARMDKHMHNIQVLGEYAQYLAVINEHVKELGRSFARCNEICTEALAKGDCATAEMAVDIMTRINAEIDKCSAEMDHASALIDAEIA